LRRRRALCPDLGVELGGSGVAQARGATLVRRWCPAMKSPVRRRVVGAALLSLTGLAALLIVSMLAFVLFHILRGGLGCLSWELLTSAPREGMTEGGIFPAIYGTAI